MSDFLTSLIAVVAVLGFMILIHEFGHYAVAKWLGVRVEQFAIGFGKRLVGFRRGDTDYRINAIPLGGYVKMSGENPMDQRTDDPREFMNHSRWHRFLIAIAGPTMNILLAIVLLTTIYMVHYEYEAVDDEPTVIGWVFKDSAAAKAGFQVGDRITRVDDVANPNWKQVAMKAALNPGQPLDVAIERNGQMIEKTVVPEAEGLDRIGDAGWAAKQNSIVITDLQPDMPAEKAGLKEGDQILALDGQPLPALAAMVESLEVTKAKPITLTVLRNGQQLTFSVQPVPADKRYRIGIGSLQTKVKTLPFAEALSLSLHENRQNALLILELVKKMVQRKMSIRSIEGPIRIGQAAGEAARSKGWTPLMGLTAAISLNLGIFNLLPIPILDGGVIMFLLIEGLMRRDISMNIKERVYQAAFVFLVLFAVMVIYNDLLKTIPGLADRLM
ncbi:MAG TPA: site-2 protease family protein [Candidatus Sulfotelmatobacter sp.]|jgi:regulator of sigma E protease|nr:site-2 protease family protein [Candidatus Sulfotelmatobacter sp.]